MKRNLIGVLLVLVAGGVYLGVDYLTGAELGEPCGDNTDCKGNIHGSFGSQCLEDDVSSYCTVKCQSPADCPAGWSCETVSMVDANTGAETGESNQVCARPVPGQPPAAGTAPAATQPAAQPAPPLPTAPAPVPAP